MEGKTACRVHFFIHCYLLTFISALLSFKNVNTDSKKCLTEMMESYFCQMLVKELDSFKSDQILIDLGVTRGIMLRLVHLTSDKYMLRVSQYCQDTKPF